MAESDTTESVTRFFYAWFGFTLVLFPLVATVDSSVLGGSLGSTLGLIVCVIVSLPAALEFLFSDRNPRLVLRYVVVFVVLYFLVILGQVGIYTTLGFAETVPAAEFAGLAATYVVTYVLVYHGGLARLKRVVGG